MLTESCVACGADVPLSDAVHLLVNPKRGEEVTDGYLCRGCYEEHIEPVVATADDDGVADDDTGTTGDDGGDTGEDVTGDGEDATAREA